MALPNPCCMPLKRGVVVLTTVEIIVDIILFILAILWVLILGGVIAAFGKECQGDNCNAFQTAGIVLIIVVCVIILIAFGIAISLAFYLKGAANKENETSCLVWLIITIIFEILSLICLIYNFYLGLAASGVVGLLFFAFKIYQIYVVICFRQELLNTLPRYPVNSI